MTRDEKMTGWILFYSAILTAKPGQTPTHTATQADDALVQLMVRDDNGEFENDDDEVDG